MLIVGNHYLLAGKEITLITVCHTKITGGR